MEADTPLSIQPLGSWYDCDRHYHGVELAHFWRTHPAISALVLSLSHLGHQTVECGFDDKYRAVDTIQSKHNCARRTTIKIPKCVTSLTVGNPLAPTILLRPSEVYKYFGSPVALHRYSYHPLVTLLYLLAQSIESRVMRISSSVELLPLEAVIVRAVVWGYASSNVGSLARPIMIMHWHLAQQQQ